GNRIRLLFVWLRLAGRSDCDDVGSQAFALVHRLGKYLDLGRAGRFRRRGFRLRDEGCLPGVADAEDALGAGRGHLPGDECPSRIADQMRALELEVVEQAYHVGRHLRAVFLHVARLVALAVPAAIQSDDLEPFQTLQFGVAGLIPAPHAGIAHPAVDEENGFALPLRDIPNLYAVRVELLVGR